MFVEVLHMDNTKTGALIRALRTENGMTQRQLAQLIGVSDKAVSKWERGMGGPELSVLEALARIFGVNIQNLIAGELAVNRQLSENMKRMKFYVCPHCRNLITAMGDISVTCCGRKLNAQPLQKAADDEKLSVERIENDYFISSDHPMTKDHSIAFVALVTNDAVLIKKQYPEWNLQLRIPAFARGRLVWYCNNHGLFYQETVR